MSERAAHLDALLEQADSVAERTLKRLRQLVPDEAQESWELEREAFDMEDPTLVEAKLRAEERQALVEPVVDRPARSSWRTLFRQNWPAGPRKTRRWSR